MMTPQARREELIVEELPDETLVYDLQRHQVHRLNRTAAFIWRQCDGQTTVAEVAMRVHSELNLPADEELVLLALERLVKAHLLRECAEPPTDAAAISRRHMMRKLGWAGTLSLLLPVVTSIAAPTPAMAESAGQIACRQQGESCDPMNRCCSGLRCQDGTCKAFA